MRTLLMWIAYLAPSLIAVYRVRQGKPIPGSLTGLIALNVLFGWTVVVWFLTLANALGFNPVAFIARRMVKNMPAGGAGMPPPGADSSGPNVLGKTCPRCNGQGRVSCYACNGSGQRYEGAGLTTCSQCMGQCTVQCSCGGSGRVYG